MLSRLVSKSIVGTTIAATLMFAGPLAYSSPLPSDGELTDKQIAAAVEKADPGASTSAVQPIATTGNQVTSGKVKMVLPEASNKTKTVSGTKTYRDSNVNYAVRGTADGMQAFSVVTSAKATREFRYDFPGQYLSYEMGIIVVRAGSASGEPPGVITQAWAKDSKGKTVETWYSIVDSTTLVQSINPRSSTTYPVVADPRVRSAWYGYSIDFTNGETRKLSYGYGSCALVAAAISEPIVSKAVTIYCGAVSIWASSAANDGQCMSLKVIILGMMTVVPWQRRC